MNGSVLSFIGPFLVCIVAFTLLSACGDEELIHAAGEIPPNADVSDSGVKEEAPKDKEDPQESEEAPSRVYRFSECRDQGDRSRGRYELAEKWLQSATLQIDSIRVDLSGNTNVPLNFSPKKVNMLRLDQELEAILSNTDIPSGTIIRFFLRVSNPELKLKPGAREVRMRVPGGTRGIRYEIIPRILSSGGKTEIKGPFNPFCHIFLPNDLQIASNAEAVFTPDIVVDLRR